MLILVVEVGHHQLRAVNQTGHPPQRGGNGPVRAKAPRSWSRLWKLSPLPSFKLRNGSRNSTPWRSHEWLTSLLRMHLQFQQSLSDWADFQLCPSNNHNNHNNHVVFFAVAQDPGAVRRNFRPFRASGCGAIQDPGTGCKLCRKPWSSRQWLTSL